MVNGVEVRFKLTTNGANATSVDVWAGRFVNTGGPHADAELTRMATLDVECGTQTSLGSALLFADEITLSNEAWPKDLAVVASGNDTDSQARLYISDMCGYDCLLFHAYGATVAEDTVVDISGWCNGFE